MKCIVDLIRMQKARGSFDARDPKGNNLLWATCQMATMRAQSRMDTDILLPIFEFLVNHGSR